MDNIYSYLNSLKDALIGSEKAAVDLTLTWISNFPDRAGVYAFWEGDSASYVGETASLLGRMRDLLDSNKHGLRRKIARQHFSSHEKFDISGKTFDPELEALITEWIVNNFTVTFVVVELGRKELQDFLLANYTVPYNEM